MLNQVWLTSAEFSELTEMHSKSANRVLRKAIAGKNWHGTNLTVRTTIGRGGKSGKVYEVLLSSLPWEYQKLLITPPEIFEKPLSKCTVPIPASGQGETIERRLEIINEALDYPPRSPERKYELDRAATKYGITVRTLQRWIKGLEDSGGNANALAHKQPQNSGRRRVWVSRKFDKAYLKNGYEKSTLKELADWLDGIIKGIWQSPAQRAGWWRVQYETQYTLKTECEKRELKIPESAFSVSRRRIMQFENHRIVDIRKYDRKKFDDMKPRIRRDNSKFEPMQQVVMDVKPLDVMILRPDGSTVHPRLIGFMDTGTHRTFYHIVACAQGEGVRQEHVIDGFIRMCMDPHWGFPAQVYRDNGTEYKMFDRLRELMAMAAPHGVNTVINAKPYSGASKPIESKFRHLDSQVFSLMEGYTGGNRMNAKTQQVGKKTKPYSGSFDEFVSEITMRITDFETFPLRSGPFKGQSPREHYESHLENGWKPVSIDPRAIDEVFSKRITRRVDRGAISYNGDRYRHPELPNGETIILAVPYRRGAWPLAKITELGWAYIEPEMLHLPDDISGAIESSRAQRSNEKRVGKMKAQSQPVNINAALKSRVSQLPARAAPAPLIDVMLSNEAEALSDARFEGEKKRAAIPDADKRRRAAQLAETESLERYFAEKKRHAK